jgi:eukaryotic-like serine/threonine-protein kinase
VLAMLQVRLSRFSAEARRVLRSASVFGETFWRGGVRALVGQDAGPEELDGWLNVLIDAEVIEGRRESRFPSEAEYRFRHALMREAAYSMLTEPDARLGHRLASMYLEGSGERDAMVLAEHAQRGGDLERAVPLYLRAAEQAFASSDWEATLSRVERGIACGAQMEVLGSLHAMQAGAHYHRLDMKASYLAATEAIALLPRGSFYWCKAVSFLLVAAIFIGELARFNELAALLLTADPPVEARLPYFEAATMLTLLFTFVGQRKPASALLERMHHVGATIIDRDATARGLLNWAHSGHVLFMLSEPWQACELAEQSVLAFTQAEDQRNLSMAQFYAAMAQMALGERTLSEQKLLGAMKLAQKRNDLMSSTGVKAVWAMLLIDLYGRADASKIEQARDLLSDGPDTKDASGTVGGYLHGALARALLTSGDAQGAETEARASQDALSNMPVLQPAHLPTLIYALLRQGRLVEAQEVARKGVQLIDSLGGTGSTEVALRLAAAEADHAAGDTASATSALRETLRQIQIRADHIPDALARERFLTQVPENARSLELARAWQIGSCPE